MPDCALCSRPLGGELRRCKQCGACEECCACTWPDEDADPEINIFSPAELGLDPEDYDANYWYQRAWGRKRRRNPNA